MIGFGQGTPAYVPSNGLIAYYPLDCNTLDVSGSGYHGSSFFTTPTSNRIGIPNSALHFNGIELGNGSTIEINHALFNIGQSEYTIHLWFKPKNLTQISRTLFNTIPHTGVAMTFNNNNSPTHTSYLLGPANAIWDYYYVHGSFNSFDTTQWYSIALVKQGTMYYKYLNGVLENTFSAPLSSNYNFPVELRISGISSDAQIFHGDIDDIGIWNRALNQTEIDMLYNGLTISSGCIDSLACNYNSLATIDDGSCFYINSYDTITTVSSYYWGTYYLTSSGDYSDTLTNANGCDSITYLNLTINILGCTDSLALNYDSLATIDDSSCVYCDLIIDSLLVTQLTCFGYNNANVDVVATGTQPLPYNYYVVRLNPTDTVSQGNIGFHSGLSPGVYVAVVEDSLGCLASDTFIINSIDLVYIDTVSFMNVSCNGFNDGYIQNIVPMGGTAPYEYSINGGVRYSSWLCNISPTCPTGYVFTGLYTGSHTVEIWDAYGCANSYPIIITEPPPISSNFNTSNYNGYNISCFGAADGWIEINITGGSPPFMYNWSNGQFSPLITGLSGGTYSLDIIDVNNCLTQYISVLTEPTILSATLTSTDETSALNDGSANAIVLGGIPPYSYNWSNGSTTNPNLNLAPGLYTVTATDANGCVISEATSVNAYNPTGVINIQNTKKILLKITDMLGQETPYRRNTPLFYIYDDGTVEKRIVIE